MFGFKMCGLTWTSAISNMGAVSADWPNTALDRRAMATHENGRMLVVRWLLLDVIDHDDG